MARRAHTLTSRRNAKQLRLGSRTFRSNRVLYNEDFFARANQLQTLANFEFLSRFVLAEPLDAFAASLNVAGQVGILFFERPDLPLFLNQRRNTLGPA